LPITCVSFPTQIALTINNNNIITNSPLNRAPTGQCNHFAYQLLRVITICDLLPWQNIMIFSATIATTISLLSTATLQQQQQKSLQPISLPPANALISFIDYFY
jgi:hypothetical protein